MMETYMGWVPGRKRSLESSLKYTKNHVLCQLGLLLFNICGIVWNSWWAYKGANNTGILGFGIGIGAFSSNALWTLCLILRDWDDIRTAKRELNFIRELEIKEELDEDRKMYKTAQQTFDETIAIHQREIAHLQDKLEACRRLGKGKTGSSKTPASLNPDIQPAPTQAST